MMLIELKITRSRYGHNYVAIVLKLFHYELLLVDNFDNQKGQL